MARVLSCLDCLLTPSQLMPSYGSDLRGLAVVLFWLASFRGLNDDVRVPDCDKLLFDLEDRLYLLVRSVSLHIFHHLFLYFGRNFRNFYFLARQYNFYYLERNFYYLKDMYLYCSFFPCLNNNPDTANDLVHKFNFFLDLLILYIPLIFLKSGRHFILNQ